LPEYHPDRDALEYFARGEALAETERWILEHLRSGCAICQRTVDELLPWPTGQRGPLEPTHFSDPAEKTPLAAGSPASARLSLQLGRPVRPAPPPAKSRKAAPRFDPSRRAALACGPAECLAPGLCDDSGDGGRCQARAFRDPQDLTGNVKDLEDLATLEALGGAAATDTAENAAWDRIFAKLEQWPARIAAERAAAPWLLGELLQRPAAERGALVHTGLRFQTLAFCDLLLDRSSETASRDCAGAIDLASLGILVADHLDTRYYGSAVVHDMLARAWANLGNARRVGADFAGAEQALAFAESLAEDGTADPLEEARLLELKASLLSDQGWFEEAAALLDTVAEICEEVKDLHRKGQALISKGIYLGCSGMPEQAVELIPQGLALLDGEIEPQLALAARQELAWSLNECGRCDQAQHHLDSCRRSLQGAGGDAWTELRLDWLEGRIAQRSGRRLEAEQRLGCLLQRCVAGGRGYEAALVMLDLATTYLEQGKRGEIRRLADDTLPIFLALDIHRQAVAALVAFHQAAAADQVTPALVRDIAAYLQRARKNPRLSFQLAA
jgi:tetratricopeptide (TPR) repeat protein